MLWNNSIYHSVFVLSIVAISDIRPRKNSSMFWAWRRPLSKTSSWLGPASAPVTTASDDELTRAASSLEVSSSIITQALVTRASEKHSMPHCRATITSGAVLIPDTAKQYLLQSSAPDLHSSVVFECIIIPVWGTDGCMYGVQHATTE